MSEVPNLDVMWREDLMAFWQRYHRPSRRDAEELLGGKFPTYINTVKALAAYAANKATAMGCREAGKIQRAMMYEHICEQIYERLPAVARW